jgi:hypothetical protein
MQQFVKYSHTIERLQQRSLSEYIGLYASILKQQSYSRALVQSRILLINRFSRWPRREPLGSTRMLGAGALVDRVLRFFTNNPRKRAFRQSMEFLLSHAGQHGF